ncbi:hypothetical protein [Methylomicrobium lacus]|uniref:hypothetical protein n=1 Tax=Methylomicrobium lacus TaxID=136992 RepID=UPI00045E6A95|nr:hypothetical protein [Methylomicrobium lacus]
MSESTQENGGNSPINLSQIVGRDHRYELSVNNETPEDAAARRAQEMADADMKRKMTFALFWFALLIVGVVFIGCVYTFSIGMPEDKKWAAGIVSAIASGLVGFLVGQGKK